MRNFTKLMFAVAAMTSPVLASAEWGNYDAPSTLYQLEPNHEIGGLHTAMTPDGKMYASWLQWSEQQGWGYDLHLQLFDEDGNPMWKEESLAVETRRNASWTAAYSLVVAPNGDAIVSWADARSEEDAESAYGHEPVIYRINQNQEYVWGDDGLTFGPEFKFPPTLYMFDGNLYAVLLGSGDYDPSKIVRIKEDGTFAIQPEEFHTNLIPCEGTDFIAIYNDSQSTVAMRYDKNLIPVWKQPAVVSEYMYSGYARNPYNTVPDGQGGFAITFARALNFSHLPIVQHISGDGEATFGPSFDVVPEDLLIGDLDYPVIGINTETESILCAWNQYGGGEASVGAQLLDYFGESAWGEEGKDLVTKETMSGYSFGPIDIEPLNENEWFVCYADETGWASSELHFACFDNAGKSKWDYSNGREISVSDPSFSFENGVFSMTFISEEMDDDWNTTYSIQNIRFNTDNPTGINGITTNKPASTEYYSIDGTRDGKPMKGINIVKSADGSVKKIMVK